MRKSTCEDFADDLDNVSYFSKMVNEAHRNQDFSSDRFFDRLKAEAFDRNIQLTDIEDFEYDEYFYNLYKWSEKEIA